MSLFNAKNIKIIKYFYSNKNLLQLRNTSTILQDKSKLDLRFENSETAFRAKSNSELLRSYIVFRLCGINYLIENQKMLLDLSRRLLGKRLFSVLMKKTFYGHFVAGENQDEIKLNVQNMMKHGVKPILDYSAEEDLEASKSTSAKTEPNIHHSNIYDPSEMQSDKNLKIFMDCIDVVENVTNSNGLAAIKVTSLARPALLLKFSSLITQINEFNKKNTTKPISSNIFEWKNLLIKSEQEFASLFNNIILETSSNLTFSKTELGELKNMFLRLDKLANHACKKSVKIFVDAEQTYFQAAIHRLTIELMRNFNKPNCIILNTYQNYLKAAYDQLNADVELAKKEGFRFGAKLVRGAYMEQERERALKMNYEDPINESYDATTRMYKKSLDYILNEIKNNPKGYVNIMIASHNEDTVRFAVEKMEEYGINPSDNNVHFGQLLGMCDYISFYLGGSGYSVFKYVPYGPLEEVLPYLSRRAIENGKGVFEKVEKEKRLVLTELKRRLKN